MSPAASARLNAPTQQRASGSPGSQTMGHALFVDGVHAPCDITGQRRTAHERNFPSEPYTSARRSLLHSRGCSFRSKIELKA